MKTLKLLILFCSIALYSQSQTVSVGENEAILENQKIKIEFNLEAGTYSGVCKADGTFMFSDATFLLDRGQKMWNLPPLLIKAEEISTAIGKKLRVWYIPEKGYDPIRFLDICLFDNSPKIIFRWGVKNDFDYEVRVRQADVLYEGRLFDGQHPTNAKVLRGGAGAEPNFVEETWKIDALNSTMLTYNDSLSESKRRTIVAGGYKYAEFYREIEIYAGRKTGTSDGEFSYQGKQPYITFSITDPQGKRIAPHTTWVSEDSYYLDFITEDPFISLEQYGKELAKVNHANPNRYNFPTLCGWMVSTKSLGEGKPINNSPALVDQMELARERGLNKYTSLAVRLEPDFYCYGDFGNTQQGWWDDEHWAKFGSLKAPYETFSKFSSGVQEKGGRVFTYFQSSMPSNDFAVAHPDWMLNKDISLLHTDHYHHRPLVRYDYSNHDFQKYMLAMWSRLGNDGVKGIKFDYPETAWASGGGFDDKSFTTTSAYREVFKLCREGMGKEAFIHERNLGGKTHENAPRLDCTVGIVDLQRVWGDASHFEPEMASRMGLRWYKQGVAYRYYPDGKSFYLKGVALSAKDRRTFLTLVGLLSGRIELGTSIGSMTDSMFYDLTRMFPTLPNGKSFRPVDCFLGNEHPSVYVYDVVPGWKQLIMVNNDTKNAQDISAPFSGDQVATGSMGCNAERKYVVFDFWNSKSLGVYSGNDTFVRHLDKGEALIYSVKELKAYPQIIGTNRHVMCGMFEVENEEWNKNRRELSFVTKLIGGEPMKIFVHVPDGLKVKEVKSEATATIDLNGNDMTITLTASDKNANLPINIYFSN
ncbi:hypothetical protein SAMN05444274_10993 [Mariniphaga anaerophila]|uniref:Uncharacterized protein n=1 Tax=Mariniphaga anaerophila TaxID=1484053 RepID=A0A1M5EM81_9BACT|nr:hypothetical protein [Mariniphaga anaerophila]SHF80339.1 hypothetical protein SAMN05444274_10993 [Mariniphaga anaerophila]